MVWLLKERYKVDWSDVKKLFLGIFNNELFSELGPSRGAIERIYYQLRKDNFNPTGSWSSIERALELKATGLGVTLKKRITISLEQQRDPLESFLTANLAEEDDDSDQTMLGDEYSDPQTPSKRSRNRPASGALEFQMKKPTSMKPTVGLRRRKEEMLIPKIGFRT